MRQVLVFGSQGFIGKNVVKSLQGQIYTFDRQPGARFLCDLRMPIRTVPEIVGQDGDVAICLASEPNVWGAVQEVDETHESRILSCITDFCISHNIRFLLHISSSNVYGVRDTPFQESMALRPINRYGVQKMLAENTLVNATHRHKDLTVVCIRMFNAIGEHQRKTMLPYLIVSHFLENRVLPIYGYRRRAWTPVADLVRFIQTVIDHPFDGGFHVFNYGNLNSLSQSRMLFEFARQGVGPVRKAMLEERAEEIPYNAADMTKAVSVFGEHILPSDDLSNAIKGVIQTVRSDFRKW